MPPNHTFYISLFNFSRYISGTVNSGIFFSFAVDAEFCVLCCCVMCWFVGGSWFQGSQEGNKLCRARSRGRSCQSKKLPPHETKLSISVLFLSPESSEAGIQELSGQVKGDWSWKKGNIIQQHDKVYTKVWGCF